MPGIPLTLIGDSRSAQIYDCGLRAAPPKRARRSVMAAIAASLMLEPTYIEVSPDWRASRYPYPCVYADYITLMDLTQLWVGMSIIF